ncbi:MAG: KOW domain-containing RNA-binding protein [Ruminococcus sp.]|nr:KOW domain-containing RNA-binding protein [Ruminococcus sp.]
MEVKKGSVVRAKAGRDKDKFFVVLEVDGEYALIADGRRRRVEHPKRKKLIHLAPTNTAHSGSADTNPKIKQILRDFNGGK